ncbi:DedD protein [Halospina denitrificans]|uniref:DedD protein n=1 Tax=Halospina denitrificans TaxID=332522 RepID=A0A4R7JU08_9GAMM|nr:SPOR domain-containing protein [Halospina denitrificans]TDT41535.1 DedD protein [Halospina denitrificans]
MDGFKQRIVGALIIVSLAVIFVPMLFDEPHQERERQTLEIPPEPDVPDVTVEEPTEPEVTETVQGSVPAPNQTGDGDDSEDADLPMADDGSTGGNESEPSPDEQPDTSVLEGAYLVQLGSFGSADNAKQLRDRAREAGMDAYIESFERDGETLTRVFAGPFIERSAAEDAKAELDQSFGLDTLVITGGE